MLPFLRIRILSRLIKEDEKSSLKHEMQDGEKYYDSKYDILDEDFTMWVDPESKKTHKQPNKANNRIPRPFHRRQVL